MYHVKAGSWHAKARRASPAGIEDRDFDPISRRSGLSLYRAPKGTWFDPAMDFREPEGDGVTRAVLAEIAAVESRTRKRRPFDDVNHYKLVRQILANGFRCHFHRRPHFVAYSRKAGIHHSDASWLSGRAVARTVDLMEAAKLLDTRIGNWGEVASVYHIKPRLYGLAQECGITASSLTHHLPLESLVRLREGNAETDWVSFAPTDETQRWAADIAAYNAFLTEQDISLSLSDEEALGWVKHENTSRKDDSPALYRPELFRSDLYRVFNNGSFEQGGRLYGGWWINAPKGLRSRITINGKPTVELDFSGCAVRMLYHERGLDFDGDPYRVELLAAHEANVGLTTGHYREGIKAIMQALINDSTGGSPERIPLPSGLSFRPFFTRAEIRSMIEERHALIGEAFGTGAGLRLQRKDSDLALAIILSLMKQGIVALPIHDSFIVTCDKLDELKEVMISAYFQLFGYNPIIH